MTIHQKLIDRSRDIRQFDSELYNVLKQFNINATEFIMLGLVRDHDSISLSRLSKEVGSSTAYISDRVMELESLGWIKKERGFNNSIVVSFIGNKEEYQKIESAVSTVVKK